MRGVKPILSWTSTLTILRRGITYEVSRTICELVFKSQIHSKPVWVKCPLDYFNVSTNIAYEEVILWSSRWSVCLTLTVALWSAPAHSPCSKPGGGSPHWKALLWSHTIRTLTKYTTVGWLVRFFLMPLDVAKAALSYILRY